MEWIIAGNVLKPAGSVQKNAGEWQPDIFKIIFNN
jgi:hypothetical protein